MTRGRFVDAVWIRDRMDRKDRRVNRETQNRNQPMTTPTALIERPSLDPKVIESVLLGGDLSRLTVEQRLSYYNRVCESLKLNPLTKPFDYLTLSGKTVLYARKDATEQLRKIHEISVTIAAREVVEGCYIVTARASLPSGRQDESIGAVPIDGLKGEARSNAMMKGETKAKRRVTLSICGLGMLDETEVETIPAAQVGDPLPPLVVEAADTIPDPPLPENAVLVRKVEQSATSRGKAFWNYTLSTGEVVKDWEQQRAHVVEQFAQNKTPIYLVTKDTKWGLQVEDLHLANPPMAEPVIQVNAEEIPF